MENQKRFREYVKAAVSAEELPEYECSKHGKVRPLVSKLKSGRIHRACSECRLDWKRQYGRTYQQKYRKLLKSKALDAYGHACACCGEANERFLSMDHMNNDGGKHRKAGLNSNSIYSWLEKNAYPENFQTLCFNCNLGRAFNGGICPHKVSVT